MKEISIGVDLAKNVFQLHGAATVRSSSARSCRDRNSSVSWRSTRNASS